MQQIFRTALVCATATSGLLASQAVAGVAKPKCGEAYSVVSGDSLSRISVHAYGSPLYQPIYAANVETIGPNPDLILIGQSLDIPCLTSSGSVSAQMTQPAEVVKVSAEANDEATPIDQLVFTFNKASAPPFIINQGIIDKYLAEITEVTEGRVTFVDPEVMNRDHGAQYELVISGEVDGAYVLNSTIAETHPFLQLPMKPMFGGSAEQTAVSLWRLHDEYLSKTDYFNQAELLGFVAAPAAHIWRETSMPVTPGEAIAKKNMYHTPYFQGLDTRGPAAMRAEFAEMMDKHGSQNEPPAFFMAHGAATAIGLWHPEASISVMEVDNGLYTPTFSVILSNEAWAQISEEDQQAIREVSGEALSYRSAAWDGFDNGFRAQMLENGLDFQKADKALLDSLWMSSLIELNEWIDTANASNIRGTEAVNFYLASLRELEDRLLYRGDETFVDQHPYLTGGN